MARFNTKQVVRSDETVNYEGARAFKMENKLELFTLVANCLLSDKFYASAKNEFKRMIELIKASNPEFVAKLAVYARNDLYLRSIPVVLIGELFKIIPPGQRRILREAANGIVQRVDDGTELAAYLAQENGMKHLPKQFLLAMKDLFEEGRFDEYQFAKYSRKGTVQPWDLVALSHPKPQSVEQNELFGKLKNKTLETPYTWETQLSERGNTKEVWEELIDSRRLGTMALVRNLRNIVKAKVSSEHIAKVCNTLTNERTIQRSKMFPYRFYTAWKMLDIAVNGSSAFGRENYGCSVFSGSNKHRQWLTSISNTVTDADPFIVNEIKGALEQAVTLTVPTAVEQVVGPDAGRVMIAVDVSGSMDDPVADRSVIRRKDIGLIMGGLLQKHTTQGILSVFGQNFSLVNTTHDVLDLPLNYPDVGHATNGWKVVNYLNQKSLHVDKIFFFTDGQLWDTGNRYNYSHQGLYGNAIDYELSKEVNKYWSNVNSKAKIYIIDLAGYGQSPIRLHDGRVSIVAGWSDAIFRMLEMVENGESVVDSIENLKLDYWKEAHKRTKEY